MIETGYGRLARVVCDVGVIAFCQGLDVAEGAVEQKHDAAAEKLQTLKAHMRLCRRQLILTSELLSTVNPP